MISLFNEQIEQLNQVFTHDAKSQRVRLEQIRRKEALSFLGFFGSEWLKKPDLFKTQVVRHTLLMDELYIRQASNRVPKVIDRDKNSRYIPIER